MIQALLPAGGRCQYCTAPRTALYRLGKVAFGKNVEIGVCELHTDLAVSDGYELQDGAPPPVPAPPPPGSCPTCLEAAAAGHRCRGYPIYTWWDQVPDTLKTKTQLEQAGLKAGPQWRARIQYGRGRRERDYALYAVAEARPKKAPTAAQLAALEAAQRALRTCKECGRIVERRDALLHGRCELCVCAEALTTRLAELADIRGRATRLLTRPDLVILDTETTGLDGEIVEIAIIAADGTVLLDTLVRPTCAISPGAEAVHGISDAMVQDAPAITEIAALESLLAGRRVAAYNALFDSDRLHTSFQATGTVPAWLSTIRWCDLMAPWSDHIGDWSSGREAYRWQPLGGGHRALGDAQAALAVLRVLAADTDEDLQRQAEQTCSHLVAEYDTVRQ